MRLSLRKAAHAAMSSAAWQEIRVRSGRDDNSIARKWPQKRSDEWLLMVPQNCHPDRSVAEWRDLLFLFRFSRRLLAPVRTPSFATLTTAGQATAPRFCIRARLQPCHKYE